MPIVRLIEEEQAPLLVRSFFANGTPGPITGSLAHVPELLVATAPFLAAIYGDSAIPARLKEIVVLRTSALKNCRYCVQTHTAVALGAGLSRGEVEALRDGQARTAAFEDARELALLNWTDALANGSGPIEEDLSAALAAHFAEHEIVELAMILGATLMLNRYCTALGLQASASTLALLEKEGLL